MGPRLQEKRTVPKPPLQASASWLHWQDQKRGVCRWGRRVPFRFLPHVAQRPTGCEGNGRGRHTWKRWDGGVPRGGYPVQESEDGGEDRHVNVAVDIIGSFISICK